jgi:redox-sensitive bicupin YhaK (pirin superfamily)
VRIVAGEFEGVRGPITDIAARPLYLDLELEPGVAVDLPLPEGHLAVAYVFEGQGIFGSDSAGEAVEAVRMAVFGDGDRLRARAAADQGVRFMLMAGALIREPIVPYGPFVMNTEEEIRQTLADLRSGTFVQPAPAAQATAAP